MKLPRLFEQLYRSPAGRLLSLPLRLLGRLQRPFMMYGFTDPATGVFRKFMRVSSTVTILERGGLSVADHIWVGHDSLLDATGGLEIGEGCQIGIGVGLYTHGSHNAIRLLGRSYVDVPAAERRGYIRKPVRVGPYTFIGSGSFVLPGVTIGRGCIIGPNCVVMHDVPDFSIVASPPARILGSTLDSDAEAFRDHDFGTSYYDPTLLDQLRPARAPQPAESASTHPAPPSALAPPGPPPSGPRVDIVTSVGGGVFGDDLAQELRREGIDARLVCSVPLSTYWNAKATRNMMGLRVRTYLLFPARVFLAALFGARRIYVVTSNPFFLPLLVSLAARLRGHPVIHWLYDLYPDALVVGGALHEGSWPERLIGWLTAMTLRACDATVFLGRHLQHFAESRYGASRLARVIAVGSDGRLYPETPAARPADSSTLTVLYSGHMGRMHDVATLAAALAALRPRPASPVPAPVPDATAAELPTAKLRLVVQANGPGVAELRAALGDDFPDAQPILTRFPGGRALELTLEFRGSLGTPAWTALMRAADVALVTMRAGAERVVMPSKTYSAMLAGQAILAICPRRSDLADTVLADEAGWIVLPDGSDPATPPPAEATRTFDGAAGLLTLFERLLAHPEEVARARACACREAHARYRHERVATEWRALFDEVQPARNPAPTPPPTTPAP